MARIWPEVGHSIEVDLPTGCQELLHRDALIVSNFVSIQGLEPDLDHSIGATIDGLDIPRLGGGGTDGTCSMSKRVLTKLASNLTYEVSSLFHDDLRHEVADDHHF